MTIDTRLQGINLRLNQELNELTTVKKSAIAKQSSKYILDSHEIKLSPHGMDLK